MILFYHQKNKYPGPIPDEIKTGTATVFVTDHVTWHINSKSRNAKWIFVRWSLVWIVLPDYLLLKAMSDFFGTSF